MSSPIKLPSNHSSQRLFKPYARVPTPFLIHKKYANPEIYDSAKELQKAFQEKSPSVNPVVNASYFPRSSFVKALHRHKLESPLTSRRDSRAKTPVVGLKKKSSSNKEILGLHLQGFVTRMVKERKNTKKLGRTESRFKANKALPRDIDVISQLKAHHELREALLIKKIKSKPAIKIPIVKIN